MKIYLDKNIFSFLRKEESYKSLLRKIKSTQKYDTYYFSSAHFEDLKRDNTDEKYDDLNFMEEITGKNYLHRYFNKNTNIYIATPFDAFNEFISQPNDTNDLFENFDFEIFQKQKTEIKESLDKIDLSDFKNDLPEYVTKQLGIIESQKEKFDLNEFIKSFAQINDDLHNNKKIYKEFRKYNIDNKRQNLKEGVSEIPEDPDQFFNSSFFDSTFMEYIEKSLINEPKNLDEKNYLMYLTAFISLNMLGLDKEKNKKASLINTRNDAIHSYYGSFCDIIVSNDNGFIEKTKILHNQFEIDSILIMTPSEFEKYLEMIEENESSFEEMQKNIMQAINEGKVIYSKKINDQLFVQYRMIIHVLRFSNVVQINVNTGKTKLENITLIPSKKLGKILAYEEVEKVVNNCIHFFGNDYYKIGAFNEIDIEEINGMKWKGRAWVTNVGKLLLSICQETYVPYLSFYFDQ